MSEIWSYWSDHQEQLRQWAWTTVWLAVLPLLAGLLIAVPLGLAAARSRAAYGALVGASHVLYTIPSLVMFLLLPTVLGTGILDPVNVAIALTIYTTSLLIPSVADGAKAVPATVLAAAEAMGHTVVGNQVRIQLPLALPIILGAVRVAAVANVSLVSVASLIGTAQLGQLFVAGNNTGSLAPIWLGLLMFLAIAGVLDLAIQLAGRVLTPWTRAQA
jgi:osmoprotectant transport system permease protein